GYLPGGTANLPGGRGLPAVRRIPTMGGVELRRPHLASPRARRKASELGVALEGIRGSGPGGHIVERDVIRHAETLPAARGEGGAGRPEVAASGSRAGSGRSPLSGPPTSTPLAR